MKNMFLKENSWFIEAKNMLKLFFISFCSVAGVGFVSGSEVANFFAKQGVFSYIGIMLTFFLVLILIYKMTIEVCLNETCDFGLCEDLKNQNIKVKFQSYKDKKSVKVRIVLKKFKQNLNSFAVFLNIFVVSGAMCSGLKSFSQNIYFDNYLYMYFFVLAVVFIFLLLGVGWLSKINFLILFFVGFVCVFIMKKLKNYTFLSDFQLNFPLENSIKNDGRISKFFKGGLFGILYVFMNMFHIKPVVRASGVRFKSKKSCFFFACFFSAILSIIILIFTNLLISEKSLLSFQMPFMEFFKTMVSGQDDLIFDIFKIGLILCLILSLVSCLIGLKSELMNLFKRLSFFKFNFQVKKKIKMKAVSREKIENKNVDLDETIENEEVFSDGKINAVCHKFYFENFSLKNFCFSFLALFLSLLISFLPFDFFVGTIYPVLGVINMICFVFC